ncbi:MAG: hypothetical protein V1495_05970 [Pseudomonadota bacterium]
MISFGTLLFALFFAFPSYAQQAKPSDAYCIALGVFIEAAQSNKILLDYMLDNPPKPFQADSTRAGLGVLTAVWHKRLEAAEDLWQGEDQCPKANGQKGSLLFNTLRSFIINSHAIVENDLSAEDRCLAASFMHYLFENDRWISKSRSYFENFNIEAYRAPTKLKDIIVYLNQTVKTCPASTRQIGSDIAQELLKLRAENWQSSE